MAAHGKIVQCVYNSSTFHVIEMAGGIEVFLFKIKQFDTLSHQTAAGVLWRLFITLYFLILLH